MTAAQYPRENNSCSVVIRVGKYGAHVRGCLDCQHCKFSPENPWNGVKKFVAHLDANACRLRQGLAKIKAAREVLGKNLVNAINDLDYHFVDSDGMEQFKCFHCHKRMV